MSGYTAEYTAALQKEYGTDIAAEHAYRPALKTYIEKLLKGIHAINDPKRQKCGSPDFIVKNGEVDIGYIEAKDIDAKLDKIANSEQVSRYLESLDNFILTDYMEFRFYRYAKVVSSVRIAEVRTVGGKRRISAVPEGFDKLETLLSEFTAFKGQTIKSPKTMAEMMARKAKLMRDVFANVLISEEDNTTLHDQWRAFQKVLIHDITAIQFADVYAQTITYGLFTARLHDKTLETFSREEARGLIPRSNPFVRQLFDYVCGASLDTRVVWIVDALCEMYRSADVESLLKSFGHATARNDPIVHFYEDFLGEYDSKLRKARGVWYTPEPVVNFIVRAVDEVLKTHFYLTDGLADTSKVTIDVDGPTPGKTTGKPKKVKQDMHRVQLLDVATGTGTFTSEAIKQIYARFVGQEGMWSAYVEEHLLPRVHGFEILMASYAMCHLKIDLLLQETGYKPTDPQYPPRLGVYLTNTLEEEYPDVDSLFAGWFAREANEASRIKKDIPIMVAYGNPPYSVSTQNRGLWIQRLLADYKKDLNEKKTTLDDDYIKFIRFSEYHIAKTGSGVVGMITNNSFLDGVTHRQMRKHLLETFDHIYILDLHGSSMKKEISPDGVPDRNVFDIMQGVSISIFVKDDSGKGQLAKVRQGDLYGSREDKYAALWKNTLVSGLFKPIEPTQPYYFFVSKNFEGGQDYNNFVQITKLMPTFGSGVKTERDAVCIHFTRNSIEKAVSDFLAGDEEKIKKYYHLDKDSRDWKVANAIQDIKRHAGKNLYRTIAYRPFDFRYTYYTGTTRGFIGTPGKKIGAQFTKPNYGLILSRTVYGEADWNDVQATNCLVEFGIMATRVGNTAPAFPLYLYPDEDNNQPDLMNTSPKKRVPNLDLEVVSKIATELKLDFVPDHDDKDAKDRKRFSSLDLFDYIYAVLHSPTYRATYREFLKIDFPRIPFSVDAAKFWQLVALGADLRTLHLFEHPSLGKPVTTYPVSGSNSVGKRTYVDGRVYINKQQYFGNVPELVWSFYVGGYQPAQKWLKDRKGCTLSLDDLRHYGKIIAALSETANLMIQIDEVLDTGLSC